MDEDKGEVKDVSLEIKSVKVLNDFYVGQLNDVSTVFGLTSKDGIHLKNEEPDFTIPQTHCDAFANAMTDYLFSKYLEEGE